MKNWFAKQNVYFTNRKFMVSVVTSFFFLIVSVLSTILAIIYATEQASSPVTDLILSNIRVFDVDGFFVYGPVVFWVIAGLYIISDPKRIPFTLKSIALFLVIRSFFLTLTHIGPFPARVNLDITGFFGIFNGGSDLFFSSHTGLPFLMAFVFWENKYWRNFFVAASLFFGAIVLMAHLHYSIDVFAAFFITYAIFRLAEKFFKKDRKVFFTGLS